ncbi:MAG: terminase family protein [Proteobacteria bacterium]|nr:terminase family protein [Pseudomonadota bacterium]
MGNARCIPADPQATFLPFQTRWINDHSRLKLAQKPRQVGWSWSAAYAAVRRTAMKGAKYDQWVSSRDETQARLFIEDCKLWADVLQLGAGDFGEEVLDGSDKQTAYALRFANDRRIHSMSSNPDAQAGKRGGRILDEFALHKDPRKLWAIAYPGITWGGQLEVFSTHRGSHNFFNQLIREIREGGNPKGISLHTVTLEDALAQGLLYKLQQKLPADDARQEMDEDAYFQFIRSGCVDEESFQQEYMCKPADDDAAFLEYDLIAACEYDALADWQAIEGRELYVGVDIGRKRDLTVIWVVERLGDVLYTREVIALRNMPKPEQEAILWPWIARARRTCIDGTGLGIGWVDDAVRRFGESRVEGITFTAKAKEALAYPVRGAMQDRKLRIPYSPAIRADLRSVSKQTSVGGNIRFTAERTSDGHADHFWALALAVQAGSVPAGAIEFTAAPRHPRGFDSADDSQSDSDIRIPEASTW